MTEIAGFALFMIWMFSGGWAFAYFSDRAKSGVALVACIVLGPFVAGIAWHYIRMDAKVARK